MAPNAGGEAGICRLLFPRDFMLLALWLLQAMLEMEPESGLQRGFAYSAGRTRC